MAVVGTAGHVDHGKSALVERLTGIDPDRFEEEKRRGLTIDLGFAWLTLPSGRDVGIVDVPGHERFIRNMLAGAGGLSACLFVVAANEGWKPQSAEHLAIIDVLRIEHGVVALTKADIVDDLTLETLRTEMAERIAGTSLSGAPIVACSAVTRAGLDLLKEKLDEVLDAAGAPNDEGRPRLWVDRVFTIKGAGTVVTGTLAGGALAEGDEVLLSPDEARARVRSIQTHKQQVARVGPANRVALNLAGLERSQAERGNAIVRPLQFRTTRHVDATVRVLPRWATGGRDHELTARGSHLLYVGSAEVPVRVRLLDASKLVAGQIGFARLTLRDPLPLQRGDRFVLRDAGRVLTFGGGEILDPLPKLVNLDLLSQLKEAEGVGALGAIVDAEGSVAIDEALFRARVEHVPDTSIRIADTLLSRGRFEELTDQLRSILADHHKNHPLELGMERESARKGLRLDARRFDDFVSLVGGVIQDAHLLRLEGHRVALSPAEESRRQVLFARLDDANFAPPTSDELDVDEDLLRSLVDSEDLVRIGNFYLTAERAREAQARVRNYITENGPATVAQIRDLLGTTRKYAVPLCEWLDASGITVRRGDVRFLGPNAASFP